LNLKTAFNTENTEKNTENTEGWLETPTHPAGELKRYLCALCVSVFSVLKELVTEFSRLNHQGKKYAYETPSTIAGSVP
jgi:hypothetical protein